MQPVPASSIFEGGCLRAGLSTPSKVEPYPPLTDTYSNLVFETAPGCQPIGSLRSVPPPPAPASTSSRVRSRIVEAKSTDGRLTRNPSSATRVATLPSAPPSWASRTQPHSKQCAHPQTPHGQLSRTVPLPTSGLHPSRVQSLPTNQQNEDSDASGTSESVGKGDPPTTVPGARAGKNPRSPFSSQESERPYGGSAKKSSALPTTRDGVRGKNDAKPSLAHDPEPPLEGSCRSDSARGGASLGTTADDAESKRECAAEVCDKCDGKHATAMCPYYKKPREDHPDALRRKPPEMGRPCGNVVATSARVIRQPGDGSCLFHSLSYGLGSTCSATSLRKELCAWIKCNPMCPIAETPLKDWLWWDSKLSPADYASRMSYAGWGGGIEMAACSHLNRINIHVWEQNKNGPGYRRISCFDSPPPAARTIDVLYQGGVHYDALVLS
ncbi:hypothetical protein DIPPA_23056 [Diplonema papillatum]|nr:hypothetical protein DIPPA_23056 [Diplonema papillatum]